MNTINKQETVIRHGQEVLADVVGTGDFVRGHSIREGSNSYYGGTWEELEALVTEHFDNHEWGTGSKNGDVILVNVPPEGFFTSIVKVDDSNRHLVKTVVATRAAGEKSYLSRVIDEGFNKQPAKFVKIVLYRADALALDDGRSILAEWEIISINAQDQEHVPMNPTTMLRNERNEQGGTLRTYTQKEWDEAYDYWDNHVYIVES